MNIPPLEKFVGCIPVIPKNTSDQDAPQLWYALSEAAAAAGLNSMRIPFFWVYRSRLNYQYGNVGIDLIMAEVRRKGFKVWAIINPPSDPLTVGWTPPSINADVLATFKKFISDMAAKYGDLIENWEILNEPNQVQKDDDGNVVSPYYEGTAFASLMRESYQALLAGFQRRGDYGGLVSARGGAAFKLYPGGTAETDITWIETVCVGLEALYAAYPAEGKYINGFSIHPYSFPKGPDEHFEYSLPSFPFTLVSRGSLAVNIDWATFVLNKHLSVPNEMFIGEYAWSTFDKDHPKRAVTPELQARYLTEGILEAHASGRITQVVGSLHDYDNEWAFWDHTGILNVDGSPKPAYRAIKNLIDQLRGMTLQQTLSWMLPNGRMFLYRSGNTSKLIFWNNENIQLKVEVASGAAFKLFNNVGDQLNDWPAGSTVIHPFTNIVPHYLEIQGGPLTSLQGVPLDANGVPGLPDMTRLPVSSANASSTYTPEFLPIYAFDNSSSTIMWNAGQYPEAWLEATLNGPQTVGGLILNPSQLPSGITKHQIYFRINNGSYQPVYLFNGHTNWDTRLVVKFPTPYQNVTHMKVLTTESPSWVAWTDIGIYRPNKLRPVDKASEQLQRES